MQADEDDSVEKQAKEGYQASSAQLQEHEEEGQRAAPEAEPGPAREIVREIRDSAQGADPAHNSSSLTPLRSIELIARYP